MSKSPAFQFYPKDWLSDANVVSMTHEQKGIYLDLLCYCWLEGSLPSSVGDIARLAKVDPNKMEKLWPSISVCFRRRGSRLIHSRLLKEKLKQREWLRKSSLGGQASARLRNASKGGSTTLQPNGARVVQPNGNIPVFSLQSSSPLKSKSNGDLLKSGKPGTDGLTGYEAEKVNNALKKLEGKIQSNPYPILNEFLGGFGSDLPGYEYLSDEFRRIVGKIVAATRDQAGRPIRNFRAYAMASIEKYHQERVNLKREDSTP